MEKTNKKLNNNYTLKDTSELKGSLKNSRTHSAKQIKKIAASIEKFGFINPIIIDSDGVIIAGHGRLEGAKKLGLETVPCILVDHLSDIEKRAYMLADNRIATDAEWDEEILKNELQELSELDFDLSFTGFDLEEVGGFVRNLDQDEAEDEVPEPPQKPKSKLEDIWILGEHRVMCGDSTDKDMVALLMDGEKADQLVTDPPYNVNYVGKTKDALTIKNDKMSDGNFRQFLADYMAAAFDNMKAGASFYIWHADIEGYNFRGSIFDCGEEVRQCLIWKKQTMVMGRQDYHWKHEPCLYGWKKGAAHLWANDRKQTTILEFDRPSKSELHPTMKPVELMEYCIKNNTKIDDMVYDAFLGSGSTLIACEKTDRACFGMELDPQYVDVIIKRWQDYTGKEAVHADSGKTYNEI